MPLRKPIGRYEYTLHALNKMRYYRLSKARVEQTIRHPVRIETGIVADTVAVMSPGESKDKPTEVWVLYKLLKDGSKSLRIITAWRYPGTSRERDPIPPNIMEEIEEIVRA